MLFAQCSCLLSVGMILIFQKQCISPHLQYRCFVQPLAYLCLLFNNTLLITTEAEKQELLSETEQLVSQVTDTRNEINALQSRFNDLLSTRDTLSEQYDVVRSHNNQLLSDVQSGDRQQEELRATIERNNVLHRCVCVSSCIVWRY